MKQKDIFPKPLFIANVVILFIMIVVLCFFLQYLFRCGSFLHPILLAIIFGVIFFWKLFLALIITVSGVGLVYVAKSKEGEISLIKKEIIFTTFGLAVSMCIGFIASAEIRSGKPNIEPSLFFPYFNTIFVLYLITRIGIGLLAIVKKKMKR